MKYAVKTEAGNVNVLDLFAMGIDSFDEFNRSELVALRDMVDNVAFDYGEMREDAIENDENTDDIDELLDELGQVDTWLYHTIEYRDSQIFDLFEMTYEERVDALDECPDLRMLYEDFISFCDAYDGTTFFWEHSFSSLEEMIIAAINGELTA